MATVNVAYGTYTALTITNLNSLASSATAGWQSARISNVSTLALDYEIVIKTKENYITSITLVRNGKPFARSERPRSLGGSQGFVAFKAPSDKLGDVPRKLKAG